MHPLTVVTILRNPIANISEAEDTMIGAEQLHSSMDDKFTQLQDDLRFRRSVPVNGNKTQVGSSTEYSWQRDILGIPRPTNKNNETELFWGYGQSTECNLRPTSMDSNKSSFALYDYFTRRTADDCRTGSPLQGQYPTFYEGYYGIANGVSPEVSAKAPLEESKRFGAESVRKSVVPQDEQRLAGSKKGATVFLKILATQLVSGTIIGRGGKGLNWFRRKSKVDDIMLSMPWELYPKTDYRTLFLKGSTKAIVKATCIIADLMLSKYTAQYSTTVVESDRMLVLVVLPLFFRSAMERIKDICNPALISITLFHSSSEHQEIVAVLKGVKSQVKELVATIANSIAKTLDPKDYCHVSYPGPDGINPKFMPKAKALPEESRDCATPQGEDRKSSKDAENKPEGSPEECDTPDETTQDTSVDADTDAETEELQSADAGENMKRLEGMFGSDLSNIGRSLNLSTAAAIAEANVSIKNYEVTINITAPESKVNDALSITSRSHCYVTTAPSDKPGSVVLSLSGAFSEVAAVSSLILSVI